MFIVVATSHNVEKYLVGPSVCTRSNYSEDRSEAHIFNKEDAEYERARCHRKWYHDGGVVVMDINFWVDDFKNPKFMTVIDELENL